jgi:hypothetical protein
MHLHLRTLHIVTSQYHTCVEAIVFQFQRVLKRCISQYYVEHANMKPRFWINFISFENILEWNVSYIYYWTFNLICGSDLVKNQNFARSNQKVISKFLKKLSKSLQNENKHHLAASAALISLRNTKKITCLK